MTHDSGSGHKVANDASVWTQVHCGFLSLDSVQVACAVASLGLNGLTFSGDAAHHVSDVGAWGEQRGGYLR